MTDEGRFVVHVVTRTGVVYVGALDKLGDAMYAAQTNAKRGRCIIEDTRTGVHHAVGADGTRVPTEIPLQGVVEEAKAGIERLGIDSNTAIAAVSFGLVRAGIAWGVFRLIVGPPPKGARRERMIASTAALVGITGLALGYHRLARKPTDQATAA